MFDILEIIREYTRNFSTIGIIKLIIDIVFIVFFLFFLFKLIRKKVKVYKVFLIFLGFLLIYLFAFALQLKMLLSILQIVVFWSLGLLIIVYDQEIKQILEKFFHSGKSSGTFSDEQEKKGLINVLISSIEYLSSRRIGALITIERQDSLNNYIDKAIEVRSTVSQELLTTLFFPGTATHDGAVILRKNKIMCAGAYFPSTERYDVPKTLGTRHRAAIGISERNDSITIVVSEETGNVSLAVDGVLESQLSLDRLSKLLETYLTLK